MSSVKNMNIRTRLIAIIQYVTEDARRFKDLEEATAISGATWRTFWNRNGGPSGEMVSAISRHWPQYAFWLATGVTDPYSGHIAPANVDKLIEDVNEEIPDATAYFKFQIKVQPEPARGIFARLDLSRLTEAMFENQVFDSMSPSTAVYDPPLPEPKNLSDLFQKGTKSKAFEDAKARLLAEQETMKLERLAELRARKIAKQTNNS